MTATKASAADISINGATPVAMTKTANGTFKYVSDWYELDGLTATGTYNGDPKNVQLVISHGCPGEPPCDPYDPYGECYVCDPYDVNAPC